MNDFEFMNQNDNMQPSMNQFDVNQDEVTLIICSPRQINNLCVRPLMYNFNNGLIDDVCTNIDKKVTGHYKETMWTPNMMKAILPEGNGQRIDTLNISSSWTFVLIINATPRGTKFKTTGSTKRFIASGICLTEPINPLTMHMHKPTINPNCVLQILHSTTLAVCPSLGNNFNGNIKRCDADIHNIPQQTGQYYRDPMYLINNKKLRESCVFDGTGGKLFTPGKALVGADKETVNIPSYESSPKHDLNNTMEVLHSVANTVQTHRGIENSLMGYQNMDPYENFITNVDSQLTNTGVLNETSIGIDITVPHVLGELINRYPNINVLPFDISATGSSLHERPQTVLNNQNTMSSLVINCMNTITPYVGLSEVMFRYDSFTEGSNMMPGQRRGSWQLQHACELVMGNDQSLKYSLEQFKAMMENDLFPILITTCGEFSLTCKYDLTGESIINLQFLDEGVADGYYIHHNKLGGIVSPHIGTMDNLSHNSNELASLLNGVSTNILGLTGQGSQMHDPFFNAELFNEPSDNTQMEGSNINFNTL